VQSVTAYALDMQERSDPLFGIASGEILRNCMHKQKLCVASDEPLTQTRRCGEFLVIAASSSAAPEKILDCFGRPKQWRVGAQLDSPASPMAEPHFVDQDLYRQLAKGREEAFSALYERYQGPIFRFAWHMSGNTATAEDVTQEVFLLLIRNPRNYDPAKGSVAGYLFGIARNLTRRKLDRSRLDEPLGEEWTEGNGTGLTSDTDLLADLARVELLECLQKAVLSLPAQYREVIVLCDLEEMSYPDAAIVLECPPGTISSRLHRARLMLKTRLECQGCVK
jgi:RNA polymerase sigma-70 factor (ECF subfamily)